MGLNLAIQWLRLCASTAGDAGSNPGRGTRIPHASQHSQKKKKKSLFVNWEITLLLQLENTALEKSALI